MDQHLADGTANPEWLRLRAGKFTASRASALMARTKSGPAASRANLLATLAIARITGQCVETYQNAAMRRGNELEPLARAAYETHVGALVEEVGFVQHPTVQMAGASPDGLVQDDGILEIKCPDAPARHLDALRSGDHAVEYRWQALALMWVTGRAWVDMVSYDPRWPAGLQLAVERVMRNESAIAELAAEVERAETELQETVAGLLRTMQRTDSAP